MADLTTADPSGARPEEGRGAVRERYAAVARAIAAAPSESDPGCCSPAASLTDSAGEQVFGESL